MGRGRHLLVVGVAGAVATAGIVMLRSAPDAPEERPPVASRPALTDPAIAPPVAVERPAHKPKIAHIRPPRFVRSNLRASGVPEPRAHRSLGPDRSIGPVDIFNAEKRNPIWAAAMELKIQDRFSARRMANLGLPGLHAAGLECRESACRVALEWPPSLEDHLHQENLVKPGEDAMMYLRKRQGQLAANTTWLTRRPFRHSNGNWRHEYLLAFSEDDIAPDAYEAAVRKQEADLAAGIRPRSPPRDIRIPPPPPPR